MISELYHIDEEKENFFSFLPRSIERLIYTSIVSIVIGYLTGFFFLEEKKVKGILKRDMPDNILEELMKKNQYVENRVIKEVLKAIKK